VPLHILNASAGSGKTYRLVQEYLRLLFHPQSDTKKFKSMMAMTFTNKAAMEMKERILLALNQIADFKNDSHKTEVMIAELSQLTGRDRAEFSERAREILSEILHNYEDFNVSTIDKFNLRLIRSFHRDLNLPQEFEVVMNESEIMEKVVDAILVKVGMPEHAALTKLVENYTKKNLEEEINWNFRNQLISFCSILSKERYYELVKLLLDSDFDETNLLQAKHQQKSLLTLLQRKANEVYQMFFEAGLSVETLPQKGKTQKAFEKLNNVETWPAELVTPLIVTTFHNGKYDTLFSRALLEKFEDLLDFFNEYKETYFKLAYFQETFYNLALLQYVAKEMHQIRTEEQFVRISEFNALISNLVQHQHAPFIYERLGNRLHHFLLDEFQDTSRLQWLNLIPLVQESLSKGNRNLIVGDAKQSIYRFNNGLAEQFVALPEIYNPENNSEIAEKSAYFAQEGAVEVMAENYRSGSKIVEFNNLLFETLRPIMPDNGFEFYAAIAQNPTQPFEGFIEGVSMPKKDSTYDVLDEIVGRIERCLKDGFKAGDICILSEKNIQGNTIAQFLTAQGYKVVSSDSLLIHADQRIRLTLAYLQIRNKNYHPQEVMKFAELFLRLTQPNSELAYLSLFIQEPSGKRKFQAQAFFTRYFVKEENFYFKYSNLYDLIQQFYKMLGWHEIDDIYLHHFCDIVFNFQQGKRADLHSFLEYYEKNKTKLAIHFPKTEDAIQIMTIHKSKGLQFPVVIIPSMDFNIKDTMSYYLIDGGDQVFYRKLSEKSPINAIREFTEEESDQYLMDKINLWYVALTRPIHRLYFFNLYERGGKMIHDILSMNYPEGANDSTWAITLGEEEPVSLDSKKIEYYTPEDIGDCLWHPELAIRKEDYAEDTRMGEAFHAIMATCESAENAEGILAKMEQEGVIYAYEKERLQSMVVDLLEDPTYKQWLSEAASIKSEAWIMDKTFKLMRPDKIIELPDKIIVVDFKTGERKAQHADQLKNYVAVIPQGIEPPKPVLGFLYYTQTKEWVSC
jgi:ATP-dependent exoDNAse (exonuclease V) beta subunit